MNVPVTHIAKPGRDTIRSRVGVPFYLATDGHGVASDISDPKLP